MENKPTIFVVDDDESARHSVCALAQSIGLQVEAFSSAEDFLNSYHPGRPGCLVTDLRMPRMSGRELQDELNRRRIKLPIIIITAFAETDVTVSAMKQGAVTLMEKPPRSHELVDAIHSALAEDQAIRIRQTRRIDAQHRLAQLTPSETDVLKAIISGKANKVIASDLDVSIRTVEMRRHNVFKKTGTQSVAELVRFALKSLDEASEIHD